MCIRAQASKGEYLEDGESIPKAKPYGAATKFFLAGAFASTMMSLTRGSFSSTRTRKVRAAADLSDESGKTACFGPSIASRKKMLPQKA